MARRPLILPRWAITPYGSDELGWETAVRQCSRVLHEWAAAGKYGYYGDLVRFVTAIPWPEGPHTHEGSQIGHLLGQVVMAELDVHQDRPLISALVVAKEDNMPSFGFWNLLAELDIHVGGSQMHRLAFWVEEVKRCFATYGKAGAPAGDSALSSVRMSPPFPFDLLARLEGETLYTLDERSPFQVLSVDDRIVTVLASTGERKPVDIASLKLAWRLLSVDGSRLELSRLERIEERRSSYMAPILAKLPGIRASSWGDRPAWIERDFSLERKPASAPEVWSPAKFVEWCLNNSPYLADWKSNYWNDLATQWTGQNQWPAFRNYLNSCLDRADPEHTKIVRKMKRLAEATEGLEN